jgi:non-specific serine/threonine protein kinase
MVLLSSSSWGQQVATWHVEFGFWREFTRKYFASLCRQYSSNHKQWTSVQPPETALFEEWLGDAPPMLGIEHLNPDVLRQLWGEIDAHTQVESGRHEGGLAGYLRSIDTDWNLIGRVTFHLAENKRNAELPFAFMATYTQGQAKDGSPQHIPLAEALRDSIASKDTTKLDQLLEPVSRAAKSVPLVAQLLGTRKLFAPNPLGFFRSPTGRGSLLLRELELLVEIVVRVGEVKVFVR